MACIALSKSCFLCSPSSIHYFGNLTTLFYVVNHPSLASGVTVGHPTQRDNELLSAPATEKSKFVSNGHQISLSRHGDAHDVAPEADALAVLDVDGPVFPQGGLARRREGRGVGVVGVLS